MAVHQTDRYRCLAVLVSSYKSGDHRLDPGLGAVPWDRLQPGRGLYIHPIFIV